MSVSLNEDFRSVKEFERHPLEIRRQVHRTGRPVFVTVKGKPDLVLLDAVTFERRLKVANLARLLAEAEIDVREGRTRPADDFLSELRCERKVSR